MSGEKAIDPEETNRSFHGTLLDRGQTCLPVRKRDRLARLARRVTWARVTAWLGRIAGEGAIFAGGLAAGAVIMFLVWDLSWKRQMAAYIGVVLGYILLSMIVRLVAWSGSRHQAHAARG